MATLIIFWLQPTNRGKKYKFQYITKLPCDDEFDAEEIITDYSDESTNVGGQCHKVLTKKSPVMLAMDELGIYENYDFGISKIKSISDFEDSDLYRVKQLTF